MTSRPVFGDGNPRCFFKDTTRVFLNPTVFNIASTHFTLGPHQQVGSELFSVPG